MRSTRISAWVGIIAISLCVGTVLGVLSIAYLDQIEQTIPSFLDKGPLPGRTVHSIDYYHPQQACVFVWSTLACLAALGANVRIRYEVVFFHSFAGLCLTLYLTIQLHALLNTGQPYSYRYSRHGTVMFQFLEERDTAVADQLLPLVVFALVVSLVLAMAAFRLGDRAFEFERARRRKMRTAVGDGLLAAPPNPGN